MTNAPKTLSDCALVVRVSIPRWDPKKNDKRAIDIVRRETNGNGDNIGEWKKYRVPRQEVDAIRKAADIARTYNYERTLPWQDGGFRLLPIALFDEYMEAMGGYRQSFQDEVSSFLKRYPTLVQEAKNRLGTLYDPDDYPSVEALSARHDFRIKVTEIGDTPDIRSGQLKPEVIEQLRDDMRRDVEAASNAAQRDLWSRMFDVAKRLSETLGEEHKVFRNTLVTRSDEILTRLEDLNVFDNPEVERVRAELQGLLRDEEGNPINPDSLRVPSSVADSPRVKVAQKAQASMNEVNDILRTFGI